MNRLVASGLLGWLAFALPAAAERINQEGRILGSLPVLTNAILFNMSNADAVVSAMQIFPVVTQRVVSWGRGRDGSEFARGNRSVDTEGFCKSQMTLNSGLRWLRATLRCFRWNGPNSVTGYPEATPRPCGSQPVATPKPPRSHPEATPRLPRGYPEATGRVWRRVGGTGGWRAALK
jgi:hypothetical protein